MDLKNKNGEIYEGPVNSGKADCTITVSDDDYMDMVAGKLDGQKVCSILKIKIYLARFEPKVGQIGPKWENPGVFQTRFQYILDG